jgi:pimeloyl-ACP methyl ester carboxylesterase
MYTNQCPVRKFCAAEDVGALDVLVSVFTGAPGPKPELLLESIEAPVLILWGDTDPLTPVDVRVFLSVLLPCLCHKMHV